MSNRAPQLIGKLWSHRNILSDDDLFYRNYVRQGANKILVWHGYQGLALKKYAFIFRPGEKRGIMAGTLNFEVIKPVPDLECVDIDLPPKNVGN